MPYASALTLPESACYTPLEDTIAKTNETTDQYTMGIERKEQGTTRQSILQLLRRHGQMTALELSESLCIGAVGVRQHLATLERDGLVEIAGLRRNVGRPSHLYMLTTEAEGRFPKRYDRIALDLINYMAEVGGAPAIDVLLDRRRNVMNRDLRPRLSNKNRRDQVAILADILIEQGYMCEYEQLEDGSFMLTEYNCPIDCIARRYPQICGQEHLLYEDLIGVAITCEGTIAQGSHCCRYHIPAGS
ncbi:regulatory protein ArsR [Oscillochloris trichoides DG-6]|uniref:Regulatory protein ArsR n=1 Tax=Oscillochloris trichoides DG-6 TaxID=765420 RepID=E1IBT9_9CHLR|nr:helix-turn-helix domain-containing protein [Oscillochloris trichoides]EFO81355.1 regulatory protein ArsR [Oscillochloris trichoides DG-6]